MSKETFTYQLKIDAILEEAKRDLEGFKKSFEQAWQHGAPPKHLLKAYEEMRIRLGSLKQLSEKGVVDGSELARADADYKAIAKTLHNLTLEFSLMSTEQKKALLDPEQLNAMKARTQAIDQYTQAIKRNKETLEKRAPLEAQQTELRTKKAQLSSNKQGYEERLSNLKSVGGPSVLTPDAQKYLDNQKQLASINEEILKTEKAIAQERAKGTKETGNNKLTRAKQRLEELNAKKGSINTSTGKADYEKSLREYNATIKELEDALKSAETELDGTESKLGEIEKTLKGLKTINPEKEFESLKEALKKLGVEGIDGAKSVDELKEAIAELDKDALQQVEGSLKTVVKNTEKLGQKNQKVKKEIDAGTESIKKQNEALREKEAFENKIKEFLGLQGAAQVLRAALRDAMRTITELDATMTEMAVVTDLTVGDYWDQLPQYSKQASELGVSINSAYKAATLYYQQGLKGNEVTKISAQTLKMAKIAGLEASDATDKMTAALRGFNMELNEASAQKVADVYSELAAITAADVDEISSAMTKTASIASSAGMEFETTAAFLSQIIETTRESAETAGTAMKTVIARFQELKKAPGEIGEIDGEIVDANKIETALRSVDVALRDSSGQFRDLDDVFLELSSKWDDLDTNTQRYIATIAAGSRQQSRFIAMMSNYGRTQELVTAANTSAGASQKQFEKTTESLEYKVEQLKNAWHEFTMGIMNSDLVKFGVDILTKFLEIVNKATSAFGGLGGSVTKILSIFTIFKLGMKIFDKFKQPIENLFLGIVKKAGISGEDSAKAFKEGAEKEANKKETSSETSKDGEKKGGVGQFIKDKSGYNSIKSAVEKDGLFDQRKKAKEELAAMEQSGGDRETREARKKKAQERVSAASKNPNAKKKGSAEAKEWGVAQKELKDAEKSLNEYDSKQQEVKDKSAAAWGAIGQGIGQAGEALTGIGVGMSMIGGLLSSLGLEEFGETLSTIGSVITMIGGALMAIPPILTMITAHPIIALITLIVGVILGTIIAIMSYINSISAEAKLEAAQKNADAAKEAAQKADQAFQELNDSLTSLDEKYDTLDNLREGTEEWNKAVQDVNASVLELIDKYPELAGLVENEGGVLKLDIESDEVQDVIKKYESSAASAKAVQYSAEAKVTEARQMVEFSNLDAVNEVSKLRGGKAFGTAVGSGAATGAATLGTAGAIAGGGVFSGILGGLGAIFGGIGGAIVGAIGGAIAGPIENAATHTDEELKKATEALALSVQEGATDTDFDSMKDFLIAQGVAADEAEVLAESFAMDTEALLEFGEATQASKAAIEAQYSAMAMQAKQMINLGAYSAQDQEQMSNIVDAEKMKALEDARAAEIAKEYEDKSNTDEFDQMKEDFAKEQFGAGARVDGDQILDEKGEVIREFEDDEEFAQAMAAAQATKEAADAMKKIPGIINTSAGYFENKVKGAGQSFEDLFTGKDGNNLTQQDIKNLQEATNNGALDKAWENLSEEERKVYGTQEEFNKEFNERLNKASESLKKSQDRLTEVNKTLVLNKKLTADAADAWVKNLEQMKIGGASDAEITNVSTELDKVLQGLTEEQAATAMAQINAIDQMDISSWEGLANTFEELGLMTNINKEALDGFIKSGIEASNAIRKINFDALANDINDTFKLLDKIKEGGRTYSESDYKELIAANKALEKSFMQVGDEFIYMGGSMDELTEAVKKNTLAQLGEANRQLQSRQGMANIIDSSSNSYGSVEYMNEYQAMSYLTEMRSKFQSEGFNIEDFGIQGLSNNTDFSKATAEQLKDWAVALASEGNKTSIYSQDYAEGLRKANIQNFSHNDATYNAQMAATEGEYADEHQEALILQAIQSGAVNNSVIESYKEAIKENNTAQIKSIGEQIAKDIDKVVEQSEGREAFNNLVDRVAKAIEDASRKEIDKLSQLYDAMNNANTQLISKIQEQINEDRAKREQEKAEKNLANLQSQQAYLMMDTSGMNTLESQTLTENIADAEQQLQDSLIDQSLQNLQDANDAAAQQRERQIMIAEQQLENDIESGRIMEESTAIVTESIEALKDGTSIDKTTMGEILKEELADSQDMSDTITEATKAANWAGEQLPKPTNTGALVTERSEAEKKADEEAAKKAENQQKTKNALVTGKNILESVAKGGFASQDVEGSELDKAFKDYNAAAKAYNETVTDQSQKKATYNTREEFAKATGVSNIHQHDFKDIGYINYEGINFDFADALTETDDGEVTLTNGEEANLTIKGTNSTAATAASARGLADGRIFKYSGGYYIYKDGQAYTVMSDKLDYDSLKAYAGGGLADFTGPAWLDGTKSRPEYVLNSAQTERFFSLIDVLERYDTDDTKKSSGDNYFEIEINVEKLENDYDVEQVANKIRKMIYEDAMYRNVNAINNMR